MWKQCVALLVGSLGLVPLAASRQDGDEEPVRDGPWLYTRNCAGCHNENGDGRGPTILELGLVARDFKQGGLAFGDTRDAMLRTISTGIPGRSPMPSFRGILSEEEMGLVVDHVRTLMPPRKDEKPRGTVMRVADRPVIARGKLPPIAEGAKETVRGLLIGTPEGMTFEYDASDVRLLGVRLGEFADREDWGDRGGGYLKPLGVPIWTAGTFAASAGPKRRLASTWTRGTSAGLAYDVLDEAGAIVARVEETWRVETTSSGAAFTRVFDTSTPRESVLVALELTGARGKPWAASPRAREAAGGVALPAWWTAIAADESADAVLVRSADSKLAISGSDALAVSVPLKSATRVRVEATYARVREWSPEAGEKLAQELGL